MTKGYIRKKQSASTSAGGDSGVTSSSISSSVVSSAAKKLKKKQQEDKDNDIVFSNRQQRIGKNDLDDVNSKKGKGKQKLCESPTLSVAAAAADTSLSLYATRVLELQKWTGKSPLTLLYELASKKDWCKPIITTKQVSGGITGNVMLSKVDAKTKELQTLRYSDKIIYSNNIEAKHHNAIYVLHSVNNHMPMKNLFSSGFRDYWKELEESRKERSVAMSNGDPFAAPPSLEKDRLKLEAKEKRFAEEKQVERETASVPIVRMSALKRQRVEEVLKQCNQFQGSCKAYEYEEVKELIAEMVRLGFREAHVIEATDELMSDSVLNRTAVMDWLCVHVPEDDMPELFRPFGAQELVVQSHNNVTLARSYSVDRLCMLGFGRNACEEALQKCADDEDGAMHLLLRELVSECSDDHYTKDSVVPSTLGDIDTLTELRTEEDLALKYILGDAFRRVSPLMSCVDIDNVEGVNGVVTLELHIKPTSKYPYEAPTILIRNTDMPSYIRLLAMQRLGRTMLKRVGEPIFFDAVSWIHDELRSLILSPPPLASLCVNNITTNSEAYTSELSKEHVESEIIRKSRYCQRINKLSVSELAIRSQKILDEWQVKQDTESVREMLKKRKKLPVYNHKSDILEKINAFGNDRGVAVVIVGETGCGKTTQVPQFILNDYIQRCRGAECNIICTQPRRLAAMSVAERVANERGERVGESTGYKIRLENKVGSKTRLTFCTTGILLRRLQVDHDLEGVSHIVVDEVHERSVEADFLLALLRRALRRRSTLTVVLMSATIDQELFSSYFDNAPIVNVPGFTHPVCDLFLEDVFEKCGLPSCILNATVRKKKAEEEAKLNSWRLKKREQGLCDNTIRGLELVMAQEGHVPYDIIVHVCDWISRHCDDGAVLVFMPGVAEIRRCCDALNSCGASIDALPLHSSLTPNEQRRIFSCPKPGRTKVVVSTNIAETSITVDDVVFVVDSGRMKEMRMSECGSISSLVDVWVSQASARQRRGRAGRVRPGMCLKLYTEERHAAFATSPEPEIVRTPLEQLCLQVLAMKLGDPIVFLSEALTPPTQSQVNSAMSTLNDVQAVHEGRLTPLGSHLANIPADIHVGKLLVYGVMFSCLSSALTIAACLSTRSLFITSRDCVEEARIAQTKFTNRSGKSDVIAMLIACMEAFDLKGGVRAERTWCDEHFISWITLTTIRELREQYVEVLASLGFMSGRHVSPTMDAYSCDWRVVRAILTASLYPQVVRVEHPDAVFAAGRQGAVRMTSQAHELCFYDRTGERVFMHPSSLNASVGNYEFPLLLYCHKVATSKLFIKNTTMTSAYPLLLFGGNIIVDHESGRLVLDGWLSFKAPARIAVLVIFFTKSTSS